MQAENVPDVLDVSQPGDVSRPARPSTLVKILGKSLPKGTACELQFPGEPIIAIGRGQAKFRIRANNTRGVSALKSLDEVRIAEAYMSQDLDLDGELLAALDLRNSFADKHLIAYIWTTYGQRFFNGQTASDKKWISQHYDTDVCS